MVHFGRVENELVAIAVSVVASTVLTTAAAALVMQALLPLRFALSTR